MSMQADLPPRAVATPESARTVANIVYALHSLAIVIGIAGSPTVIGSFIGSVPSIIAVILNYVKRSEADGTWLESHYRWQIRTFWFAVLWFLIALLLFFTLIGIPLAGVIFLVITAWVIYRIARGWLRLRDHLPMYV
jgi:uncharacterized membrane protein